MTTQTLVLLFVGGLVLLVVGAEVLVRGASRLAVAVGITPLVVGMTVVAYGTSAPEVAVTVQAMYSDPPRPDMAIGNVVGSNISNILLVLGLAAIASPLIVSRTVVRATLPFMVAVTGLVWWLGLDGSIDRVEGLGLLAGAIFFSVFSVARSRRATTAAMAQNRKQEEDEGAPKKRTGATVNLVAIIVGLVMLVLGARWLVAGASEVARLLQVSDLVVALTIVAVGTSLPEIATSLVAGIRGHRDIAVGNVVGSNIFNLLLVLGLCASVAPRPVEIPEEALRYDIPIMFGVSLACLPVLYTKWIINRWEGLAFVCCYAAYAVFLFMNTTDHPALPAYKNAMIYVVIPGIAILLVVLAARHWLNGSPGPITRQQDQQN